MSLVTGLTVCFDGKDRRVNVEVFGRGGWKSPELWLIHADGKRLTPYYQRKYNVTFPLNSMFKMVYRAEVIAPLIYTRSPLLDLVKKDDTFTWGSYLVSYRTIE